MRALHRAGGVGDAPGSRLLQSAFASASDYSNARPFLNRVAPYRVGSATCTSAPMARVGLGTVPGIAQASRSGPRRQPTSPWPRPSGERPNSPPVPLLFHALLLARCAGIRLTATVRPSRTRREPRRCSCREVDGLTRPEVRCFHPSSQTNRNRSFCVCRAPPTPPHSPPPGPWVQPRTHATTHPRTHPRAPARPPARPRTPNYPPTTHRLPTANRPPTNRPPTHHPPRAHTRTHARAPCIHTRTHARTHTHAHRTTHPSVHPSSTHLPTHAREHARERAERVRARALHSMVIHTRHAPPHQRTHGHLHTPIHAPTRSPSGWGAGDGAWRTGHAAGCSWRAGGWLFFVVHLAGWLSAVAVLGAFTARIAYCGVWAPAVGPRCGSPAAPARCAPVR